MAADRIDLFFHEAAAALSKTPTSAPLKRECEKLSVWLQKHQGEMVPSAQQAKLITILDIHVKTGKEAYSDSLLALVQTLLALPEGKLIAAKSKQKCLKILDSLSEAGGAASKQSPVVIQETVCTVLDVDTFSRELSLLDPAGRVIDNATAASEQLLGEIVLALSALDDPEAEAEVRVSLRGLVVLSLLPTTLTTTSER